MLTGLNFATEVRIHRWSLWSCPGRFLAPAMARQISNKVIQGELHVPSERTVVFGEEALCSSDTFEFRAMPLSQVDIFEVSFVDRLEI